MRKLTTIALSVIAALALVFALSGCEESDPTATQKEDKNRTRTQETLVNNQPAESMSYSPTRETKNFWIRTWDEPGKLSYVYIANAENVITGYYVFEGLPVSYCVGLIPPYTWVDIPGDGSSVKQQAPAPSVDGTFSSGNDCTTKYGKDAVSGSYIEFNVGMGQNYMLFSEPLPPSRLTEAVPLGFATTDTVKQ